MIRNQGLDIVRQLRILKRYYWVIILSAIVGWLLGLSIYKGVAASSGQNNLWRISNDYYLYFDTVNYPNGVDHYNAFTWDSILRDDPVVDVVLEMDSDIAKSDVFETVTGEMLGDYRILTVRVTGSDADMVQRISDAYKIALPEFANRIGILEKIELWTDSELEHYDAYTRDYNAALLGGIIGLLCSLFLVLLFGLLDDHIYTEADWVNRYPFIPWLGMEGSKEYPINLKYIVVERYENTKDFACVDYDSLTEDIYKELRSVDGVVLKVPVETMRMSKLDKLIYALNKQDVNVVAACGSK